MSEFEKKAKNFFILGKIAENLKMFSESASNYFKSLSALNDLALEKIGIRTSSHNQRFNLLKQNIPKLYDITDKLFSVYRRTYTQSLNSEELLRLRKNIEEAFEYAKIDIPDDKKIK